MSRTAKEAPFKVPHNDAKATNCRRHGDLMVFELVDDHKMPDLKPVAKQVLAEGEVTGHMHTVDASGLDIGVLCSLEQDGDVWFSIEKAELPLTHQEHSTITLPPGKYFATRQEEYDPNVQRRRVMD